MNQQQCKGRPRIVLTAPQPGTGILSWVRSVLQPDGNHAYFPLTPEEAKRIVLVPGQYVFAVPPWQLQYPLRG